jgi:hypothetical protein
MSSMRRKGVEGVRVWAPGAGSAAPDIGEGGVEMSW